MGGLIFFITFFTFLLSISSFKRETYTIVISIYTSPIGDICHICFMHTGPYSREYESYGSLSLDTKPRVAKAYMVTMVGVITCDNCDMV